MADSDDEQMHEVSDAELESMISSNTGDIESLDDDSLGSNDTSVDNEVYDDDDDMVPNYDPKPNLDGDIDSIDDQDDALEYERSDDDSVADSEDGSDEDDNDSLLSNTKMSESSTSPVAQLSVIDSDDDEDSDDEALDNKFEIEGLNEFLAKYHPESKQHNYDEIYALSEVIRDSKGIIIDDLHRTLPILSKYEKTRVLGQRAKQINTGSKPFIEIDENIINGYLIAQEELHQKKIPFIIRRPLPSGGSEYWYLSDLEVL